MISLFITCHILEIVNTVSLLLTFCLLWSSNQILLQIILLFFLYNNIQAPMYWHLYPAINLNKKHTFTERLYSIFLNFIVMGNLLTFRFFVSGSCHSYTNWHFSSFVLNFKILQISKFVFGLYFCIHLFWTPGNGQKKYWIFMSCQL